MATCDRNELLADAGCFAAMEQPFQRAAMIALLQEWGGNTDGRNALMADAGCYACMDPQLQRAAIIALLMQINGCNPNPCSDTMDPSELGERLVLWFKADAIEGATDQEQLPTWNDSSSFANVGTARDYFNVPYYVANGVNGLPSVYFPFIEGGDFSTSAGGYTLATPRSFSYPFSVYFVHYMGEDQITGSIPFGGLADTQNDGVMLETPSGGTARAMVVQTDATESSAFISTDKTANIVISEWHIGAAGATTFYTTGMASPISLPPPCDDTVEFDFLGAQFGITHSGYFCEAFAIGGATTDEEKTKLRNYLICKWGEDSAVPATPVPAPSFWLSPESLDASASYSDGDPIHLWNDASANHANMVDDNTFVNTWFGGVLPPTYKPALVNGYSAATWPGSALMGFQADGSAPVISSFFIAGTVNVGGNVFVPIGSYGSTDGGALTIDEKKNLKLYSQTPAYTYAQNPYVGTDAGNTLFEFVINALSGRTYYKTGSIAEGTFSDWYIGGFPLPFAFLGATPAPQSFNGSGGDIGPSVPNPCIAEFKGYSQFLDANQRAIVRAALNTKFGF